MVVAIRGCIARPDEERQRFGLTEHLIAVAEGCGHPDGSPEEKLAFLAGLLHDAAKATWRWQDYIRGRLRKGPNHAPLGAALFAFWAEDLVAKWTKGISERQRLSDLALDWTRIVYDHHSAIRDLTPEEVPWIQNDPGDQFLPLLEECDQDGLTALVRQFFPESQARLADFGSWLTKFEQRYWPERMKQDRASILRQKERVTRRSVAPLGEEGLRLAELGAKLIFADRSHAADWDVAELTPREAEDRCLQLGGYCGRRAEEAILHGASATLVRRRSQLSATALQEYRRQQDAGLITLLLPTGCGKTLAGLRIALEACRLGRCRRIIYVAPYLSILSQAAVEIRQACGLEVFVHHHMSAAMLEDHQPYDVLETWQVPVLATTFNQLCRALFPRRAQQCLRIPALDHAFILVDEPQIVNPMVWNLFLKALEVTTRKRRCQVLFLTATMPPTDYGLDEAPVNLVPQEQAFAMPASRYTIHSVEGPWDPERSAAEATSRLSKFGNLAAIFNTVRDAVDVFDRVRKSEDRWYCMTARMLPGHKQRIIREIRERLDHKGQQRVGVISSQVIEAGVDLSFRSLLRARPILSSVVQAAGRVNRHGEGQPAEVVVFPFIRANGTDSRPWIYDDEKARRYTDEALHSHPDILEHEVAGVLQQYYREWSNACPNTACLDMLKNSAHGKWSAIAGLTPFADDMPRIEVFITGKDGYLPEKMGRLMNRFAPGGSQELIRKVQDNAFRRTLSFLDQKRLSALVQQFTVSVPERIAREIATQTEQEWLRLLNDGIEYSDATGLALTPEDDNDSGTVIV
jgi:CRISPR-associated helicase Cas3/CRISPR-associated endonuclease Cas3-HD